MRFPGSGGTKYYQLYQKTLFGGYKEIQPSDMQVGMTIKIDFHTPPYHSYVEGKIVANDIEHNQIALEPTNHHKREVGRQGGRSDIAGLVVDLNAQDVQELSVGEMSELSKLWAKTRDGLELKDVATKEIESMDGLDDRIQ